MTIIRQVASNIVAEKVAALLLEHNCIQISTKKPFTYASGLTGPIYCDNRLLLSFPAARKLVIEMFLELVNDRLSKQKTNYDYIGGIATGGIPYAAIIADRLELPMIYVRGQAKSHGKSKQVEGFYEEGHRVIIFEDLVNQGKSLGQALAGLKQSKIMTVACFCLVDYEMMGADQVLEKYGLPLYSLTNFETLIRVAEKTGHINEKDLVLLRAWHRSAGSA